ncbi:ABC transporter substrate-binding protein [Saccharomonospora sp. CUA-673]|uniref:MCE family protein n=1 Tax=Saccharomonospora sp. CUA-673 TaxID=1904969 RepID=UPI000961A193|nr:MCE family protein [Saccharomonospora sp. CUA-673]OLT42578.1 ABC transporter substrate-binding protein [Saccharomonospora sp. CUA-673]
MATLRRRLLGLLLVGLMVGGVALSVAIYNKAFTDSVEVRLEANQIGNQLGQNADVKVRGLIVGRVGDIQPGVEGSTLTLNLDPEHADLVPNDVSARFLPKTLFGERFVDLEVPQRSSGEPLRTGDVIPQDRTESAIELEQAFSDLMPVLQAVQPQKLSSTLSAISTALQGRGEDLGDTITELGQYVEELNPHVPKLQENLRELAKFSHNISDVTPDLVDTLDNLTTTADTFVERQHGLENVYTSLTGASTDLQSWLEANSQNLINLGSTARPTAELLAKYAPGYPCFLGQMADLVPRIDEAFGKGTNEPGLHAKIEITNNRGPYKPGVDDPEFNDHRGPRCYDYQTMPNPFPQYPPDGPVQDGASTPEPARSVNDGLSPADGNARAGGYYGSGGGGAAAPGLGDPAGSPGELRLISQLTGPQLGMDADEVPDWGALLMAPMYRGAEVTVE